MQHSEQSAPDFFMRRSFKGKDPCDEGYCTGKEESFPPLSLHDDGEDNN